MKTSTPAVLALLSCLLVASVALVLWPRQLAPTEEVERGLPVYLGLIGYRLEAPPSDGASSAVDVDVDVGPTAHPEASDVAQGVPYLAAPWLDADNPPFRLRVSCANAAQGSARAGRSCTLGVRARSEEPPQDMVVWASDRDEVAVWRLEALRAGDTIQMTPRQGGGHARTLVVEGDATGGWRLSGCALPGVGEAGEAAHVALLDLYWTSTGAGGCVARPITAEGIRQHRWIHPSGSGRSLIPSHSFVRVDDKGVHLMRMADPRFTVTLQRAGVTTPAPVERADAPAPTPEPETDAEGLPAASVPEPPPTPLITFKGDEAVRLVVARREFRARRRLEAQEAQCARAWTPECARLRVRLRAHTLRVEARADRSVQIVLEPDSGRFDPWPYVSLTALDTQLASGADGEPRSRTFLYGHGTQIGRDLQVLERQSAARRLVFPFYLTRGQRYTASIQVQQGADGAPTLRVRDAQGEVQVPRGTFELGSRYHPIMAFDHAVRPLTLARATMIPWLLAMLAMLGVALVWGRKRPWAAWSAVGLGAVAALALLATALRTLVAYAVFTHAPHDWEAFDQALLAALATPALMLAGWLSAALLRVWREEVPLKPRRKPAPKKENPKAEDKPPSPAEAESPPDETPETPPDEVAPTPETPPVSRGTGAFNPLLGDTPEPTAEAEPARADTIPDSEPPPSRGEGPTNPLLGKTGPQEALTLEAPPTPEAEPEPAQADAETPQAEASPTPAPAQEEATPEAKAATTDEEEPQEQAPDASTWQARLGQLQTLLNRLKTSPWVAAGALLVVAVVRAAMSAQGREAVGPFRFIVTIPLIVALYAGLCGRLARLDAPVDVKRLGARLLSPLALAGLLALVWWSDKGAVILISPGLGIVWLAYVTRAWLAWGESGGEALRRAMQRATRPLLGALGVAVVLASLVLWSPKTAARWWVDEHLSDLAISSRQMCLIEDQVKARACTSPVDAGAQQSPLETMQREGLLDLRSSKRRLRIRLLDWLNDDDPASPCRAADRVPTQEGIEVGFFRALARSYYASSPEERRYLRDDLVRFPTGVADALLNDYLAIVQILPQFWRGTLSLLGMLWLLVWAGLLALVARGTTLERPGALVAVGASGLMGAALLLTLGGNLDLYPNFAQSIPLIAIRSNSSWMFDGLLLATLGWGLASCLGPARARPVLQADAEATAAETPADERADETPREDA